MKIPHLKISRRAWVRFLRDQGQSTAEIAEALGITEVEVMRLTDRRKTVSSVSRRLVRKLFS